MNSLKGWVRTWRVRDNQTMNSLNLGVGWYVEG